MVPHLEGAGVTMWETAILISIRLCLSPPSTHKSLLQSEINSYWSALISQVRRMLKAMTGTSHLSQCWKHHSVCEISALHAEVSPSPPQRLQSHGVSQTVLLSWHLTVSLPAHLSCIYLYRIWLMMVFNTQWWYRAGEGCDRVYSEDTA